MNRSITTGLAIVAIALFAGKSADATFLAIDDVSFEGSIVFNVGQFDGGGFFIDGRLIPGSEGIASATVSEGTAATGPITHTFFGQFVPGGALVQPTSGTIAFTEAGGGVSDILTFSYTGSGVASLVGTFVSDLDTGSLVAPPGATLVSEGTPFFFNNTNITAAAISDAEAMVPLPDALPLFATGIGGLGLLGWRRKRKAQAGA